MKTPKLIQSLNEETINQIAAGEVIEKPACIIRELLDNAVDAGADEIIIKIDFHNLSIEVHDNGCGIPSTQLALAFKRHTTSKINRFEDIFSIHTLGFRGEALAAIASICEVSVETSCDNSGGGFFYRLRGGKEIEMKSGACNKGTKIVINDLFFNTPVRKKFLSTKTSTTTSSASTTIAPQLKSGERNYIKQEILRHILSSEGISFKYFIYDNKKEKLEMSIPKQCSFKEKILTFFKSNQHSQSLDQTLEKCLLPIDTEYDDLVFKGYITNLHIREKRSDKQFLILKNRVVREPIFLKAISTAYLHKIPWGTHPMIFLKVVSKKSDHIDINVHPRKEQVKFQNNQWFFKTVYEVVKANLKKSFVGTSTEGSYGNDPLIKENKLKLSDGNNPSDEINQSTFPAPPHFKSAFSDSADFQVDQRKALFNLPKAPEGSSFPNHVKKDDLPIKVLGQIADGYIIFSIGVDLYIVDQHAAHERINYDRLHAQVKNQSNDQQMLLIPLLIEKSIIEKELILNHQQHLQEMGFEIDDFGESMIKVSRVPSYLPENKVASVVDAVLEMISNPKIIDVKNQDEFLGEMIARMACRMSIMSGDKLSHSAMEEIIKEIYEKGYIQTCPHGRPFVKKIDFNEMKAFFDRGRHLFKSIET